MHRAPVSRKVLIVDDSPTVRASLVRVLESARYEVIQAEDGADGEALIANTPDLALVICDVNMPRMNGLEMLSRIKQGNSRELAVIMLATELRPSLIARARAAGIRGWMTKPIKPDLLLATVRRRVGSPDNGRAS